ncbi:MAG: CHASE2 domain-containing protein, partial [Chromatiales bacterium]|nr:CHASE2 domain-containing protein [Chromatiales bacterium]
MRQRILILLANLALLLPLLLHAPGAMDLRLLDTLERYTYDLRINLDLATDQDPRIVIVDIDESSLARIGRWPWPRDLLARLVDTLFDDYGIAVLGFDVVFAEPDDTPGDRLLRELLPRLAPDQHEAMGLQQPVDDMLLARDSRFAMSLAARPVV